MTREGDRDDSSATAGLDSTIQAPSIKVAVPLGTAETARPVPRAGRQTTSPSLTGREIGDYVFGEVVGKGAMGVIYAATDSKLKRKVAIKVIRGHGSSKTGDASDRLVREAQAMARLSHPNVITIFQAGTIDDQVYVAMEFIDGETLTQWLARTKPTWKQALEVLLQAGHGLQAAHAAGLVHRDFKPDNILIRKDGRVLVSDFGLARATLAADTREREPSPPEGDTRLTQTGAVMGTPLYMAPEQHEGATTDARSDQYSFCVTLYEACYGRRPFEAADIAALAAAKMQLAITPVPAGARVPRWLRALILRGLRVAPSERFPQLQDLLVAIERRRARGRGVIAASVVALALVGVGAFAFARSRHADPVASCAASAKRIESIWNPTRSKAVGAAFAATPRRDASESAGYVSGVLDAYTSRWVEMHREACVATHGRHEQSEALLDRRMYCLNRRALDLQALVELFLTADAAVVAKSADAVNGLGSLEDCAATDAMIATANQRTSPEIQRQTDALVGELAMAKALASSSHAGEALQAGQQIVAKAKASGIGAVEAEALLLVAGLLRSTGKFPEARDVLVRASSAGERIGDSTLRATALIELSYVEGFELRRFAEGHVWAKLANDAMEGVVRADVLRARLLSNEGSVYFAEGNYERARANQTEALAIQRRVLGPKHVDVADTLDRLGSCMSKLGRSAEALDHHRAAVAINSTLGTANLHVAESLNNLGNALAETGDYDGAAAEYRKALEIWKNPGSPDSAHAGIGYTNLGALALLRGDHASALREFANALAAEEATFGPTHPVVAETLTSIGVTQLDQGATDEAIASLDRALAILSAMTPPPIDEATTRFALARALWAKDRRRSLEHAHTARSRLAAAGPGWQDALAEVDVWLAERQ